MFCFGVGGKDSPNFDVFCLEHLLDRKHPQHFIDYSLERYFSQNLKLKRTIALHFIRTYNPNHNINLKKFHSCRDRIKNKELKTYFRKKNMLLSTRKPPNLHKLLTTAKFERL